MVRGNSYCEGAGNNRTNRKQKDLHKPGKLFGRGPDLLYDDDSFRTQEKIGGKHREAAHDFDVYMKHKTKQYSKVGRRRRKRFSAEQKTADEVTTSSQRVAVLVDVANVSAAAWAQKENRVNFRELLITALKGRQLANAIAYCVQKSDEPGEPCRRFFDQLSLFGYQVKRKTIQNYADGVRRADWDVGLTIDAMLLLDREIDVFVIVSGDGDFVDLVRILQAHGRRVEVMAFGRSMNYQLKAMVDRFVDLNNNSNLLLATK